MRQAKAEVSLERDPAAVADAVVEAALLAGINNQSP